MKNTFVIERMVENGRWIHWRDGQGGLFKILHDLAEVFPTEALESVRVRRI